MKAPEPPRPERSILTLMPGDIVEVSLVTYEVIGKADWRERREMFLTLRDGNIIRYLKVEQREKLYYKLFAPIDGRLDSADIPTTIELEDIVYHLEEQYAGHVLILGHTPFPASGEQHVWDFQSDQRKLLRIEWQAGKMMMYEGEAVLPADVQVIRAT
nr:DUF4178 domain-containing protein [Ectobacillus ponti]